MQILKKIHLIPIFLLLLFYKKFISPFLPPTCIYYPTCSKYSYEAFKKHSFIFGTILSTIRLLKCNPFFQGGIDLVPEKKNRKQKVLSTKQ